MRKIYAALMVAAATAAGILGMAPSHAEAQPTLIFQNQVGTCFLSSQDTDPATGIAYFILEDSSTDVCTLTLREAVDGPLFGSVSVTHTAAVLYMSGPDFYQYNLDDLTTGAGTVSGVYVTGSPLLPALPPGSTTSGGCSRALEQRIVEGHFYTYDTGFNIVSPTSSVNCTNQVTSSPANPVQSSATVFNTSSPSSCGTQIPCLVQVAIPDPFGITLDKSVTTTSGKPVGTAAPGEKVIYHYLLTNTEYVPWTVTINDDHPGITSLRCPASQLPARTFQDCTASYTVTEADLRNGKVSDTATATATDNTRANPTGQVISTGPSSATFPVSTRPAPPSPAPPPHHRPAPHHRPHIPVTG